MDEFKFMMVLVLVGGLLAFIGVVSTLSRVLARNRVIVSEGQRALVYRHGRFEREVGPGRYWAWGGRTYQAMATADQSLVVPGQDILTADRLAVRMSALATYRIVDLRTASEHHAGGYYSAVYQGVQIAMRNLAAELPLDALLDQRTTLDQRLSALSKSVFTEQGCELVAITIRDISMPADVRRLTTDVVRARLEAAAALERARGEQATLRSLANSARVLKGNPELMNLRLLHALQGTSGKAAPTLILSGGAGLVPIPRAENTGLGTGTGTGAADVPDDPAND